MDKLAEVIVARINGGIKIQTLYLHPKYDGRSDYVKEMGRLVYSPHAFACNAGVTVWSKAQTMWDAIAEKLYIGKSKCNWFCRLPNDEAKRHAGKIKDRLISIFGQTFEEFPTPKMRDGVRYVFYKTETKDETND